MIRQQEGKLSLNLECMYFVVTAYVNTSSEASFGRGGKVHWCFLVFFIDFSSNYSSLQSWI